MRKREVFAKGPRECFQCGADMFRLLPDSKIECPTCGAAGRLNPDGTPDFSENVHCGFSEKAVREHFRGWLVGMKESS